MDFSSHNWQERFFPHLLRDRNKNKCSHNYHNLKPSDYTREKYPALGWSSHLAWQNLAREIENFCVWWHHLFAKSLSPDQLAMWHHNLPQSSNLLQSIMLQYSQSCLLLWSQPLHRSLLWLFTWDVVIITEYPGYRIVLRIFVFTIFKIWVKI